MNKISEVQRYIINEKAVIIFWKDGEKTIAKVDVNDKFDKELGFMLAFHKYLNRHNSKNEMKKLYDCMKDDKFKDYLFIIFNRFTFKDTVKARKYLANLKKEGNK